MLMGFSSHGDVGRATMPHLKCLVTEDISDEYSSLLSKTQRRGLILTLLSASEFSDTVWKKHAIQVAKKLIAGLDDPYICAVLAYRESIVYRLSKEQDRSNSVLETFFCAIESSGSHCPRMNAQHGLILLSSAKVFIQQDRPEEAVEWLSRWKPLNERQPSTMEKSALCEIKIELGNVWRLIGDFDTARQSLEAALEEIKSPKIYDKGHVDLICYLGDVYCELNDPRKARDLLECGFKQLDSLTASAKWMRLNLSLAETYIRECSLGEGERILLKIQSRSRCGSPLSKYQELRLYLGLARIAHLRREWPVALQYWTESLKRLEIFAFAFGFGHTTRVIHYSISVVLFELGDRELSAKSFAESEKMAKRGGCKYWVTGISSYWFEYVSSARARL